MKMRRSHLWVFGLALAFVILWCVSIGMTVKASSTAEATPTVAQAAAATNAVIQSADIVEDKLQLNVIGIAGWCLVGVGFLGVAVTVAFGTKPKKRRRPARAPMPRNPSKVINTVYSPESRKYSKRVERRR